MYFRKKTSAGRTYLQIVESRRQGKAVREQVFATLGRPDELEASGQLERLLRSGARFAAKAVVLEAVREDKSTTVNVERIGPPLVFERLWEVGVTTPEQAARKIESDSEAVARLARLEAERGSEWAAIALAEQRTAELLADRESEHRGFAYWWRPGGMCLNLYLWLQNTMVTPVLFNGFLKLQVPMIPWEHLIAFTALYCGLYMGGHTVKAVLAR